MIKKIAILLLFICCSQNAYAGFWDALGACFTDPCNCGDGDKARYEKWDEDDEDDRTYKGSNNSLCPPWNKSGGRDDNTCLVKGSFPNAWIAYYENICGEETPESSYFEPKIRVRGQQCNAVACWTTSTTLSWDGECVPLASGYGFPLHRMCARIAVPAEPVKEPSDPGYVEGKEYSPADPGYTKGEHLNFEGATKADTLIETSDGEFIIIESPKLCLYYDPSILLLDLMDYNPTKQIYHKTEDVHPIVKVIIFLIDAASDSVSSPFDLISALISSGTDGAIDSSALLSALGEVIDFIGEAFISILKEVGQINRLVDSQVYGCVNLPLGPFPPPFCKTVDPLFQIAQTQRICPAGIISKRDEECVTSKVRNNYVHNAIRIGYKNFLPLCKDGENPMETDKCVVIENADAFMSAKIMHAATADVIKHCDNAVDGAPCVRSKIPHQCSNTDEEGCKDGFRIVYAENIVNKIITPKNYYHEDINDCPDNINASCQEVWGINIGEFVDISLPFPEVQDGLPLSNRITLVDKNGEEASFDARIVIEYNREFMQEPNQICVLEGDFVIGCEKRALHSVPLIYECNGDGSKGIPCTSSYFDPKLIVSYKEGNDVTSALLEVESTHNTATSLNYVVNLAGNEFEAFATDDSFATKAFSGPNSINPASIFGTYQDNILPVVNGVVNSNAVLLYGLEYINGKYHAGGKHICLSSTDLRKCPDNKEMCVLTNMLNRDTVKCSTFRQKATEHKMGLCSALQTSSCNPLVPADSLPKISGGSLAIRQCADDSKCYDGGVELCKISTDPQDRHKPAANLGDQIPDESYSINDDLDLYALRDKTFVEMGMCIPIPTGYCAEQNDPSQDNGFAYWPETEVGKIATGVCMVGKTEEQPLKRYCTPDPENTNFKFEPLYRIGNDGSKTYTTVRCKEVVCSGTDNYLRRNGFAKWSDAIYGENSIGECRAGWEPEVPLLRKCIQDPDTEEYILEPVYKENGDAIRCKRTP